MAGKSKREKITGRREKPTFVGIPMIVMDSPAYCRLGGWDVKLLMDIARQYNGYNNGDLCAAWKTMKPKGWNSKGTLNRALQTLQELGFVEQTRQGGRNRCSLFSLTWQPIDECKGKLDVSPTQTPSNRYRTAHLRAA